MYYLFLAIICSSSIALTFKHTENLNLNRNNITSYNYITASIISLFFLINALTTTELKVNSIANSHFNFSFVLILGIITGYLFYYSFILYQKNIKLHGSSLTGMFIKLGILIPMIISIIFWKEYPTLIQSIAIFIALFAIVIVNYKPGTKIQLKTNLVILFFVGGFAEFSNKIFQKYAITQLKPLFLLTVFLFAFLFSFRKFNHTEKIRKKELFFGIIVGVFNLFSSFFLIKSLDFVKTSLAFALFSSLSMTLILIGSKLIYDEQLKKKNVFAIVITIFSLFLINI